MKKGTEKRNIALILTAPEKKIKKESKSSKQEKQYGLPEGFKLIGFDVRA